MARGATGPGFPLVTTVKIQDFFIIKSSCERALGSYAVYLGQDFNKHF